MTISTQLVLRALLAEPGTDVYGAQIGEAAGLMSGTVHPILARLEGIGWVESHWEDVDPQAVGRPVRRFYRITPPGAPFTLAWRWNTCRSHSRPASVARGDRGDLTMRPAPQPMQPGGVHPTGLLPRLVVWGTTLVLPTAEVRHRYHREHVAELSVLAPRGPQRWYALGALATAWTLRRVVFAGSDRARGEDVMKKWVESDQWASADLRRRQEHGETGFLGAGSTFPAWASGMALPFLVVVLGSRSCSSAQCRGWACSSPWAVGRPSVPTLFGWLGR